MPWSVTSRPAAVLLAALVVLSLGASLVLADAVRSGQREQAAEEHTARAVLAREVDRRHGTLAPAAMRAHESARVLRDNLAETLAGSGHDLGELADERDEELQRLRAAATELNGAAARPPEPGVATRPGVDPTSFDRLDRIDARAASTAGHLRRTADDAERWARVADPLARQAEAFASRDLPATEDPGELADRWRSEAGELTDYRDAAEDAAGERGLEEVGRAHLRLVDGMDELAGEAATLLEDGDVEAYHELLDDRLGDEDPFGFGAALEDALDEAAAEGPIPETAAVRQRCLDLLDELNRSRLAPPGTADA